MDNDVTMKDTVASGSGSEGRGLPLPDNLERARTRVTVGYRRPSFIEGTYSARAYSKLGIDNSLNLEAFRRNLRINFISNTFNELVFDLIGVDAPIANALRRILLAEVPTVAIEKVFIRDNSSIIHDEMLAHRLGLVPLRADPTLIEMYRKGTKTTADNTVKFNLKVKCTWRPDAPKDKGAPPETLYVNSKVTSDMLEWIPIEGQIEKFGATPPAPVHDDILIAKLRPGQTIDIEAHAVKSIGKDHAKWSPVATASYRMFPEITIKEDIFGKMARELKEKCPANVFDIEDSTDCITVARPEDCTMCRECIREEGWDQRIELARIRDHFVFSIESTGAMASTKLFKESIRVLAEKLACIDNALTEAEKRRNSVSA